MTTSIVVYLPRMPRKATTEGIAKHLGSDIKGPSVDSGGSFRAPFPPPGSPRPTAFLGCFSACYTTPMHRLALPIALILLTGCPTPEEQAADVFTEVQLFHDAGDLDKAIGVAITHGCPEALVLPYSDYV